MAMQGIDISNFKSNFDPNAVSFDFLVVQCTWGAGETTVNGIVSSVWPGADAKIQACIKKGKPFGYMHYIQGNYPAEVEAQFFADHTKGYLRKGMPSVDWEAGSNRVYGDISYLDRWVAKYIAITGVPPMIYYSGADAGRVLPVARKHNCGTWPAAYGSMAPTGYQDKPWGEATYGGSMRQYASSGRLPGFGDALDLDIFYGDISIWNRYVNPDGKAPAPTPAPAPAPAKQNLPVTVHYGLHVLGGGWLGDIVNFNNSNSNGFAGNPNHQHDFLYAWVDRGDLRYSVHTVGGGWLPFVNHGNKNDTVNGCAGMSGHAIDGVKLYYTTPAGMTYKQSWYRSQTTRRAGWLGVCCDDGKSVNGYDGFAGVLGEPMDRLQISINDHNPF